MSLLPSYLLPGHALREALDKLQADIDSLHAERESIKSAPRTVVEVEAFFEREAARYSGLAVAARSAASSLDDGFACAVTHLKTLTYADICWLFGDMARNAMRDRVSEMIGGSRTAPVADSERRKAVRLLDDRVQELETEEEREVLRLSAQGYRVLRRSNVNPKLLLHLWQESDASAARNSAEPLFATDKNLTESI